MRATKLGTAAALVFVLAVGCGSTSPRGPGNGAGGSAGTTTADITEYQTLSSNVQSAAAAYGASAANITLATCKSVEDHYDAEVRPWITSMVHMAGGLDAYISDHGGGGAADLGCASASMLDELDYHRSVACTYSSAAADQNEAARDANALASYASHARTRCGEMLGSGPGECCNWGPMMNGCGSWSSTCCSSMMRWGCCGAMMGGGMMGGGTCCGSGW